MEFICIKPIFGCTYMSSPCKGLNPYHLHNTELEIPPQSSEVEMVGDILGTTWEVLEEWRDIWNSFANKEESTHLFIIHSYHQRIVLSGGVVLGRKSYGKERSWKESSWDGRVLAMNFLGRRGPFGRIRQRDNLSLQGCMVDLRWHGWQMTIKITQNIRNSTIDSEKKLNAAKAT